MHSVCICSGRAALNVRLSGRTGPVWTSMATKQLLVLPRMSALCCRIMQCVHMYMCASARWCRSCSWLSLQVRYTAVRRQGASKQDAREVQVLDFQSTGGELLPLVAAAYALIFMVRHATLLHSVLACGCCLDAYL